MHSTVTIATYNVLADAYIRPEYYPLANPKHLLAKVRYPRVIERIIGLNADVLCLQEVDDTLLGMLECALRPIGYDSIYARKARNPEGPAIFVRSPWRVLARAGFRFRNDATSTKAASGYAIAWAVIMHGNATLSVTTSHLKWDPPDATERIGLLQAREILSWVGPRERFVICGDFNAAPDDEILRLFAEAGYRDAFDPSLPTFNARDGARKIDYLLHPEDMVAAPLAVSVVTDATPLPDDTEPSDHVPLVAKLTFDD